MVKVAMLSKQYKGGSFCFVLCWNNLGGDPPSPQNRAESPPYGLAVTLFHVYHRWISLPLQTNHAYNPPSTPQLTFCLLTISARRTASFESKLPSKKTTGGSHSLAVCKSFNTLTNSSTLRFIRAGETKSNRRHICSAFI